jgi:hypothetical protein
MLASAFTYLMTLATCTALVAALVTCHSLAPFAS